MILFNTLYNRISLRMFCISARLLQFNGEVENADIGHTDMRIYGHVDRKFTKVQKMYYENS